jgi:hypothetical protein
VRSLRVARTASLLLLLALGVPGIASASPALDPPFDARGYDSATIDEIWSSRSDADGHFESKEFVVPASLTLVVAGYPRQEGMTLALERSGDRGRLTLDAPESGFEWNAVSFAIPRSWIGARARIVASAGKSPWWIGVTSPVAPARDTLSEVRPALLVPFCFVLFLLPGVAASALTVARLEPWARIALVITASCLAGYAAFFVYFFSPAAGAMVSIAIVAASVVVTAVRARSAEGRRLLFGSEIRAPFAMMLLYSIFTVSLTFLYLPGWPDADEVARSRYVRELPGDNALPQYLAENMWAGSDSRYIIDGWQSSDRPPLQTGILLLQRPVIEGVGAPVSLCAQVTGVVAQSAWIAGIWVLCSVLATRRATLVITLLGAGMSGFFLLNTAYVWPKLIAAALGSMAIAVLVVARRNGWTQKLGGAFAAMAALAMLSHSGAVLTLLPAVLLFALGTARPRLRDCLLAALVAAILLTPWSLYRRLYAPPGDRLAKTHLAGQWTETDRTLGELLVENYRRVGPGFALRARWQNTLQLFEIVPLARAADAEARRTTEWNRVLGALGALNLAWLLLGWRVMKRRGEGVEIGRLYWLVAASLLFWIALMFTPTEATAHHLSYSTIVLLFVLAGNELSVLPWPGTVAVLGLQATIFGVDWLVLTPPQPPASAIPVASTLLAIVATTAGAGFVALAARARSGSGAVSNGDAGYS